MLRSPAVLSRSTVRSSAGTVAAGSLPSVRAVAPDRLTVIAVEEAGQLTEWIPQWEALARATLEPNVFYEPWQILPALEAFGQQSRIIHLFLFSVNPRTPAARPLLCAYFPLERIRRFRGLPMPVLTLWKYIHCFLCTPLVRPGYEGQALAALLEWARSDPRGASVVQLPQIAGDGLFTMALAEFLEARNRTPFVSGVHDRALLVPLGTADEYLLSALSTRARKNLRRQTRRLSEEGRLEFEELEPDGDLDAWVRGFLALEASGWKGRANSALDCHEAERWFFKEMTRLAFLQGRLMMLAMTLDGRPVAMKCNLLAGPAVFAFKIAFDETLARHSPGVMLEIENIRRLHAAPGIRWMDSCAASDNTMANRLCIDRRTIHSFAISSGSPVGDLLVGGMRAARWLARALFRPRRSDPVHAGMEDCP